LRDKLAHTVFQWEYTPLLY